MYTKCVQLLLAFTLVWIVSSTRLYTDERESALSDATATTEQETETNCTVCYKALAAEVLNNAANYLNLQMTFFPPNGTSPDFVIVKYIYETDSERGTAAISQPPNVWFWSSAVYFFYHPIRIFVFTSLGFSDPLLQQSILTIYLPAECLNASEAYMKLLTQRLKLYAMHQKLNAPIDNNYQAKSHSVDTLIEWHRDNPQVSRIVLSSQFVFPFLATVFLLLFFIYVIELEPRNVGRKLNNQIDSTVNYIKASGEAKILIILTISVLFNICTLIADSFALHEYRKLSTEVRDYYDHNMIEFRCFYMIPYVMIAFDICSLLFIIIPVVVTIVKYYHRQKNRNIADDDGNEDTTTTINWSILLYTLLSPVSCVATHAYHIIIAFIDNCYHAGSVLLLYITVLFIHVVVFQKIYYYLVKWTDSREMSTCCDPIKKNKCYWLIFLLGFYFLGITSLTVIIGLTVSILMLLPIDNAIDNAPNNVYAIYQGSVAVIAALVTFQVFFRETNSLTEVFIKARDKMTTNTQWTRMSEKEKELELAKLFLEYISHRTDHTANQPPEDTPPPHDPNLPPPTPPADQNSHPPTPTGDLHSHPPTPTGDLHSHPPTPTGDLHSHPPTPTGDLHSHPPTPTDDENSHPPTPTGDQNTQLPTPRGRRNAGQIRTPAEPNETSPLLPDRNGATRC